MPAWTLGALLVLLATLSLGPGSAVAEQASQPSAVTAGWLDAGRYHTCAVVPVGNLRCWGYGGDGALGYANTATIGDDETPADAGPVNAGAGVVAVSAGTVHTCTLLDAGAVRCWGFGGDGRLGYGNVTNIGDNEHPADAGPVDLGAGAQAISAGRAHTCAVLAGGAVRCWGFNFDGRLGYGYTRSIGDDETPASPSVGPPVALGDGRTARAITAGDSHTCALLDDGNVRCWGYGQNGQLGYASVGNVGDDETVDRIGPIVLGGSAVAIAAGDFHNCAILADGSVRCWGFGGNGRLGYGNTNSIGDNETPADAGAVNLGSGRAKAITAGDNHSCALLEDGSVRCWGYAEEGQLGYANRSSIGDDETPAAAGPVDLGAGRTAVAITAGGNHTCARLDDDSVRCWGRGLYSELGYCGRQSIGDDETPAAAGPVSLGVPGVPAAGCPVAPPPPPPPPPAADAPAPAPGQPAAPAPPVARNALAEALRLEARRARDLRACRAAVTRRTRTMRARALRLRQPAARLRALRSAATQAGVRRRLCMTRFSRTPGRVTTLTARASSRGSIVLAFKAPGTHGSRPPAARGYLVRQSLRPIRSTRDFARAKSLCKAACRFPVRAVGSNITLRITDLRRRTTYYYAVAARDNVSGRLGLRSRTARATTR